MKNTANTLVEAEIEAIRSRMLLMGGMVVAHCHQAEEAKRRANPRHIRKIRPRRQW